MNIFKAVYGNQYYELKPKGKEAAAKTSGTRLLGIALALNFILLCVIAMVLSPDLADAFGDAIKDIFGRRQGRFVGKIVAIVPFLIFLPIVRYTLGTEAGYQSIISEFEALSPEEQKRISKKGMIYAIASMLSLFVSTALALAFFG